MSLAKVERLSGSTAEVGESCQMGRWWEENFGSEEHEPTTSIILGSCRGVGTVRLVRHWSTVTLPQTQTQWGKTYSSPVSGTSLMVGPHKATMQNDSHMSWEVRKQLLTQINEKIPLNHHFIFPYFFFFSLSSDNRNKKNLKIKWLKYETILGSGENCIRCPLWIICNCYTYIKQ